LTNIKKILFYQILIYLNILGIGDWGLGIGDWGLGIGPNPQSPIPNPHKNSLTIVEYFEYYYEFK
jgi:hypothetical protein